ncbi:glycoside hydrolase superfamily [Aspergillus recurvatus]
MDSIFVVSYMQEYGLDGVDIDWGYLTASDRGGSSADSSNLVVLLAEMREASAAVNPGWDISCTRLPSYWCLQTFSLEQLQNEFSGAYLRGHTNLTGIDRGFDLLWRNDIDPKNAVMGIGFYGGIPP